MIIMLRPCFLTLSSQDESLPLPFLADFFFLSPSELDEEEEDELLSDEEELSESEPDFLSPSESEELDSDSF